jgi:hypothetical protein
MLQVKVRTPVQSASIPERGVLFISYAYADREDVKPFVEVLQPLVEREQLELFYDFERLKAGDVWSDKLESALKRCKLFVLLATPASLASDFCIQRELLVALDRQRRGDCRIVPVVLRDCDWKGKLLPDASGELLSRFQALPKGGAAVAASSGAARDAVWLGVVNALADVLADPAAALTPPLRAAVEVPALLPYLCDQSAPESDVRDLLKAWSRQTGPLVVMLRAQAPDCPDHFIKRIDERHLSRLLPKLTPGLRLPRHSGLQWPLPHMRQAGSERSLQAWFLDQIVERVMGDAYCNEDELLQCLRDEGSNRLFIGGVPTAPPEFVRLSLQALGQCLAGLTEKLDKVRLAAALWSEDPALAQQDLGDAWDSRHAFIGRPAPLGSFDRQAMRSWALLDEVQKFAAIDQTQLDEAFAGAAEQLTMREFAAIARPLLQRQAS